MSGVHTLVRKKINTRRPKRISPPPPKILRRLKKAIGYARAYGDNRTRTDLFDSTAKSNIKFAFLAASFRLVTNDERHDWLTARGCCDRWKLGQADCWKATGRLMSGGLEERRRLPPVTTKGGGKLLSNDIILTIRRRRGGKIDWQWWR